MSSNRRGVKTYVKSARCVELLKTASSSFSPKYRPDSREIARVRGQSKTAFPMYCRRQISRYAPCLLKLNARYANPGRAPHAPYIQPTRAPSGTRAHTVAARSVGHTRTCSRAPAPQLLQAHTVAQARRRSRTIARITQQHRPRAENNSFIRPNEPRRERGGKPAQGVSATDSRPTARV